MQIFINGWGSISAAGVGAAAAYERYRSDEPTWSVDTATGLPVYRIGKLPDDPTITAFTRRRAADRTTELALHAARQAVREAGWEGKDFAILVGCSRGPTGAWEESFSGFQSTGEVATKTSPQTTLGSIGFALADFFGTTSLATGMSVTCSSGFHALLHAVALLEAGMVERVLVGGAEAPITPFTLRQMQAMRIYAAAPEAPHRHACRPLTGAAASGMVVGEGAAFVALSRLPGEYAITGLGFAREKISSSTGISPEGLALFASMQMSMKGSNGLPGAVVAHDPGTERGGLAERRALDRLFANPVRVLSNKHLTGHTFGASGPLGLDFALSVLQDEAFQTTDRALVNATGFGGNAVSVSVARK